MCCRIDAEGKGTRAVTRVDHTGAEMSSICTRRLEHLLLRARCAALGRRTVFGSSAVFFFKKWRIPCHLLKISRECFGPE